MSLPMVDDKKCVVKGKRKSSSLTDVELAIFSLVLDNGLVPIDNLMEEIWKSTANADSVSARIYTHICNINKKLRPLRLYLTNRSRRGYSLRPLKRVR